jgi:hypothetical protein
MHSGIYCEHKSHLPELLHRWGDRNVLLIFSKVSHNMNRQPTESYSAPTGSFWQRTHWQKPQESGPDVEAIIFSAPSRRPQTGSSNRLDGGRPHHRAVILQDFLPVFLQTNKRSQSVSVALWLSAHRATDSVSSHTTTATELQCCQNALELRGGL